MTSSVTTKWFIYLFFLDKIQIVFFIMLKVWLLDREL